MKILVYLGHPAHFYNYKNSIPKWKEQGHEVFVLIKKKDILEELLINAGISYVNILEEGRKDSRIGILFGMLKRSVRLFGFCVKNKPDILTGTSVENSFVGKVLRIPVVNINEDDAEVVPLYAKLSYPTADVILMPVVCSAGKWEHKAIKYSSYHELAYLHPSNFQAKKEIVAQYMDPDKPYFILRFAKLTAHHDVGIQGFNNILATEIVAKLLKHGNVYITSERPLPENLDIYRIRINPLHMHHVMAFARMYMGDSQTMAAEAGVLGIPFIRFNDFVGRIGYLRELEEKYELGVGIRSEEQDKLIPTMEKILATDNMYETYQERRLHMLSQKIDYSAFLTWFISNYPESARMMRENPEIENQF